MMAPLKGTPRERGVVGQPVNCWTSALKLEEFALRRVTGVFLEARDLLFKMTGFDELLLHTVLDDDLLLFELTDLIFMEVL